MPVMARSRCHLITHSLSGPAITRGRFWCIAIARRRRRRSPSAKTLANAVLLGRLFRVAALATHRHHAKRDIAPLCNNDVDQQARLDRLVERIRERLRKEEPFHLPSEIAPLRLHDGVLWGLSNFELRHPPQLVCGNDYANLTMLMGLVQPHVRYRWNFTPIPGVTGQFIAHADRATVDVFLQQPLDRPDAKATVKSLTVTELSQIWVKVPSVPVVSWFASQIGNLGTMINRRHLKRFLQDNLRSSIQKTLDKGPL